MAARPVALALAAVLVAVSCNTKKDTTSRELPPRTPPAYAEPPLLQPDANGVRQLHLALSEINIDGQRYCLRSYNGVLPGPIIRVPEGTDRKVRIDLHNDLPDDDWQIVAGHAGFGPRSCHDFSKTNLHGHGLHVQPEYATLDPNDLCKGDGCASDGRYYGDNVLTEVGPGGIEQVRWDLDEDGTHHEGTDWYHPHVHGSTAIQVMNGDAGALLIDGPLDHVPGIEKARERVMLMHTMPLDSEETRPLQNGETCSAKTMSMNYFRSVDQHMPILVNGLRTPRMQSSPGQVERWRMIYAGNPDEAALKLFPAKDATCQDWDKDKEARLQFVQIARDGMTLPQLYRDDTVWLSPGYRVDAMIQMPEQPATYCLVARRPNDLGGSAILILDVTPDAGPVTETHLPDEAAVAKLAMPTSWTQLVDGQEKTISCDTMTEPDQKIVLLAPTPEVLLPSNTPNNPDDPESGSCEPMEGMDHMAMTMDKDDGNVCTCPEPNVSCRRFDQRRARGYRSDRVLTVGHPELWEVRAFDGHPYHIHTNPFLVCPTNSNKEPNFAHWRDTYWVQVEDGARHFIMNPKLFVGRFMMHCHKLNHEDEGMMELVETCAPGDASCRYLGKDAEGDWIPQGGCKPDDLQCQFAAIVTAAYPVPPKTPDFCSK